MAPYPRPLDRTRRYAFRAALGSAALGGAATVGGALTGGRGARAGNAIEHDAPGVATRIVVEPIE